MRFQLLILLFLVLLPSRYCLAQDEQKQLIPSIKELIFPAQPEIRNNFNLFYEIHLNRDSISQPSFWYKIIFSQDSEFEFSLFPLVEGDLYDFYLYKVKGNALFCDALERQAVVSLNDYKFNKTYNDRNQSEAFRASILRVKPIPVKAGDAIYLEVLATQGKDCGHIFDCRTSESSLVTKVFNDNCNALTPIDLDSNHVVDIRKEAIALRYLGDLFCLKRKTPIAFTSINLSGKTKTVKQQNDFLSYSQAEYVHTKAYKSADSSLASIPDTADKIEPPKSQTKTDSALAPSLMLKNDIPVENTLKLLRTKGVKSTADLNRLSEVAQHHTVYSANDRTKVSRFEVDKALFSILLQDLQTKREGQKERIKTQYAQLKKMGKRDVSKRRQVFKELKAMKAERKAIEARITDTKLKIKLIEHSIAKQDDGMQENFVFNKSTSLDDQRVVYKIQIGVYKNKISPEIFKGLSPVSEDPYEGGVRYSVGAFPKFDYAKQAKAHVVEIGLKDAFIVAYFNGKRIGIKDAIRLER